MKKERRKKSRVDKSCIQEKWSQKDCDTAVVTFFESPGDAEQRANKRKQQE